MQCLAWVVSTVILKFMLSVIFGASDDVSQMRAMLWTICYFLLLWTSVSFSLRGSLNSSQGFWLFFSSFFLNRPTSAVLSNPSSQATKTLTRWCTHVQLSLTSLKQRWAMWSGRSIFLRSVSGYPLKLFHKIISCVFRLSSGTSKPCCFQLTCW